jgi:hypothetical protein
MATAENFSFTCGFVTLTASLALKLTFIEQAISIPCSTAVFLAAPTLAVCLITRLCSKHDSDHKPDVTFDGIWAVLLATMIGITTGALFSSLCHSESLANGVFAAAALTAFALSSAYSIHQAPKHGAAALRFNPITQILQVLFNQKNTPPPLKIRPQESTPPSNNNLP